MDTVLINSRVRSGVDEHSANCATTENQGAGVKLTTDHYSVKLFGLER